jgi:hypothetical protein
MVQSVGSNLQTTDQIDINIGRDLPGRPLHRFKHLLSRLIDQENKKIKASANGKKSKFPFR